MTKRIAPRNVAWIEERLFDLEYHNLQVVISVNLSSQQGWQYVGMEVVDTLTGEMVIATTLTPVPNTHDLPQVIEVVADALRAALAKLTPFP